MSTDRALVIQVFEGMEEKWDGDNSLCSLYIDWAGYSVSALANTVTFLNALKKCSKFKYMLKETENFMLGDLKGRVSVPSTAVYDFINNANNEIEFYNEPAKKELLLQLVIDCLQQVGNSKILGRDYDYMKEHHPTIKFNKGSFASARGVIGVSEESQEMLIEDNNVLMQVFLREQEIWSDAFVCCPSEECLREGFEYNEDLDDDTINSIINNMEELKQDPSAMTYDEIEQRMQQARVMNETNEWYKYEDKFYRSI